MTCEKAVLFEMSMSFFLLTAVSFDRLDFCNESECTSESVFFLLGCQLWQAVERDNLCLFMVLTRNAQTRG